MTQRARPRGWHLSFVPLLVFVSVLGSFDSGCRRSRTPSRGVHGWMVPDLRRRHHRAPATGFERKNIHRCLRLVLLSTQPQSDHDAVQATDVSSSSSSSCPFSMTFRRHKIDLTIERRNKQPKDDSSMFSLLEKLLPKPVDDSRQTKKWQQRLFTKNDQATKTPLLVRSNVNGVAAMSWLWERTAALCKENRHDQVILVLPDASKLLVQNFVEILQWMADKDAKSDCQIRPSTMDATVPAIRLVRSGSLSSSSTVQGLDRTASSTDTTVNTRTKHWVRRILVEQGICPFTKSDKMSGQGLADLGVPVGSIAYHTSFQHNAIGLFADTWRAILEMIEAGPNGREGGVSSILLAAPAFDDDFEYWAGPIFAILEASVVAAQAEAEIGVVCFHPKYATPDGTTFPGFGHMHSVPRLEKWYKEYEENMHMSKQEPTALSNLSADEIAAGGAWQRRTPHATINVLRANQLEAAESRRESAKMYTENIEKLVGMSGIGNDKLMADLAAERQLGM